MHKNLIIAAFLTTSLFIAGCGGEKKVKPHDIEVVGNTTLPCALAKKLSKPIQLLIHGKKKSTSLGGSSRPPAAGARVSFWISEQPDGARASLDTENAISDAGGSVFIHFKAGERPGIYKISACLADYPEVKPVTIVILGGVVIHGNKQDGRVGGYLETPLAVRMESSPGVPVSGAKVQYEILKAPSGTKLSESRATSNENGEASVMVAIGKKQGQGKIGIRMIDSPLGSDAMQYALTANFFAVDYTTLFINVLGGLAIFIFGMRMMSDGLSLVAGEKLRVLLNWLTRNRFTSVIVGVLVTGLIQSSSACTVMVIGFVNAGLMQLEQAIGVIMGSNIGTTVTAQMISFKLGKLALPAVAAGVIVQLLAKKSQNRFIGQIMVGFGLLFLGMGMMSGPLKELRHSETMISLFHGLSCAPVSGVIPFFSVIKAVAMGAILTMVVQSSSASIGLLLALSGAGLLDVYTAFAILLGDNIGTTITAILASIGSSISAKRAACAHLLFNLLGTFMMVVLYFVSWPGMEARPIFMELVHRITSGDAFAGENLPRFLANAHTLFNSGCTVLFVGLVPVFAIICRRMVPGPETEVTARRFLDPRLLQTPSIAIQQAWSELGVMLEASRSAHGEGFRAIMGATSTDWEKASESVREREKDIDNLQTAITDYLSNISLETLTETQGEALPHMLHSVNDAERIGDHSMHFLRLARRVRKRSLPFTPEANAEMQKMFNTVERLFGYCFNAVSAAGKPEGVLTNNDAVEVLRKNLESALDAAKLLDKQEHDFRKAHVVRHESGGCDIRSGVVFLDVLLNIRRVGGHLFNIIEAATKWQMDNMSR